MEVLVYAPFIPESRARDLGVRLTDLQTVLSRADVLTVHVPLTDDTESMIRARERAARRPRGRGGNRGRQRGGNQAARHAAPAAAPPAGAGPAGRGQQPPGSPAR